MSDGQANALPCPPLATPQGGSTLRWPLDERM